MKKINLFLMISIFSLVLIGCTQQKDINDYSSKELAEMPKSELRELTKDLSDTEKEELAKKIARDIMIYEINNTFNNYDEESKEEKINKEKRRQNAHREQEIKTEARQEKQKEEVLDLMIKEEKRIAKEGEQTIKNKEESENKPDLELLNYNADYDEYGLYILGDIKNNTNKIYSYAKIEISLLDKNENLIDNTLDIVKNLQPGQVWKFKARILNEDAASFVIEDITGF